MTSKEALERINNFLIKSGEQDYDFYSNQTVLIIPLSAELGIIKQDLDRLKKLEKVIEILKRFISIKEVNEGMYFINSYVINELLTKEQYELLKEVLGNE